MAAATNLFLERGYARTSLVEVAARADVSERTVYVRFAGKAELLKRVIDVAVVGDTQHEPLSDRSWTQEAMTARTLEERIGAFASGVAAMQARLAPLVAVALEVEAAEPVISEQAAKARRGNHEVMRMFWGSAARDGLVPADLDVEQVAETTMLLSASETALLRSRVFGSDDYEPWLRGVMHQLVRPAP